MKFVAGIPHSKRLHERIWWSWDMPWWSAQLRQELRLQRFYAKELPQ